MVYVVNDVLARGVDMLLEKDLVGFALQKMEIHPLMLLIQILSMIFQTFSPTLRNPSTNHTPAMLRTFVPIPSESEDTSGSDSDCDLPLCDDFSPINVYEEKSVTFSNPLFDSNDDFTSSDDESLSNEVVPEHILKLFEPSFEFESSTSLVTHTLSDSIDGDRVSALEWMIVFDLESKTNDWKKILYDAPINDLIFDPGGDIDDIDAFLDIDISTNIKDSYYDSKGDTTYLESLLIDDTIPSLPPKVFLDHDPRSLSDINDLKIMVKVFDPGIHEKKISPTYVSLPFEDRHYLSLTYVIRNFLPYFTYPVDSSFPLSSGSEDIIFDPDISAFHFSSLEPVAYECLMEVCSSSCFVLNITMIWESQASDSVNKNKRFVGGKPCLSLVVVY
ncbi:hypothetical protein Tco_1338128 [Tanacetum coccineum]